MKKNFTINLCGRLFQIDEDAYEMLQNYITSLRSHFGRQSEGEEIVTDIEERIAELFDELKTKGTQAINIDHVKDIITRIGKPEQLADEDTPNDEQSGQQTDSSAFDDLRSAGRKAYDDLHSSGRKAYDDLRSRTAGKRLFRNPKDKIVFGVLSGVAAYTNTDPLLWRLGTVIFTFFYGIGFIIYVVMALIIPEAKTPEQRLQMEGKAVNPQNLADEVIDDKEGEAVHNSTLREIFSILLKIIIGFFVGISAIVGLILAIVFFGVLTTLAFALIMPAKTAIALPFTLSGMGLTEVWTEHPAVLIAFAIALLVALFIPVYAIIHMFLSLTKTVKPMSVTQRIVWLIVWIVCFCATIPLGGMVGMLHDEYQRQRWNQVQQEVEEVQEPLATEDTDSLGIVAFSDTTQISDSAQTR